MNKLIFTIEVEVPYKTLEPLSKKQEREFFNNLKEDIKFRLEKDFAPVPVSLYINNEPELVDGRCESIKIKFKK